MKVVNVWSETFVILHKKETPKYLRSKVNSMHLVEALRYKTENRGFNSRRCHWNFSLISSFRPQCFPGV